MKKILRYVLISAAGWLAALTTGQAQSNGQPDAFGYRWFSNTDTSAVTFNWVDIVGRPGTDSLQGLADDNSVGPVDIGFDFRYFFVDYSQLRVGSNGWLSFSNVGNIASCFLNFPTPGGGDNVLAPLLSDLNLDASPNSDGAVYVWSNNVDSCVITYQDVSFWINAADNNGSEFIGSNTFQVILNGADRSITYQYLDMEPTTTLTSYYNCPSNFIISIGWENVAGNIGRTISTNEIPANNTTYRILYPDSILIQIADATIEWNNREENFGIFKMLGDTLIPQAQLANVGNADFTSPLSVNTRIRPAGGGINFNQTVSVASLDAGTSQLVTFPPYTNLNSARSYEMTVRITNTQDGNATNNLRSSEIVVLQRDQATPTRRVRLNYGQTLPGTGGVQPAPANSVSWSGGANNSGMATYIEPPYYPAVIRAIEFFHLTNDNTGFRGAIFAESDVFGQPGTELFSQIVTAPEANAYNVITLTDSIVIDSGGFYLAWFMGAPEVGIGMQPLAQGPIALRSFEIISGAWAPYRERESADAAMGVYIDGPVIRPVATFEFSVLPDGDRTVAFVSLPTPNPGAETFFWDFGDGNTSEAGGTVVHTYDTLGSYEVCHAVANAYDGSSDTICQTVDLEPSSLRNRIATTQHQLRPQPMQVSAELVVEGSSIVSLELYDLVGRRLSVRHAPMAQGVRLFRDQLAPGTYVFRAVTNTGDVATGRLLVQ